MERQRGGGVIGPGEHGRQFTERIVEKLTRHQIKTNNNHRSKEAFIELKLVIEFHIEHVRP